MDFITSKNQEKSTDNSCYISINLNNETINRYITCETINQYFYGKDTKLYYYNPSISNNSVNLDNFLRPVYWVSTQLTTSNSKIYVNGISTFRGADLTYFTFIIALIVIFRFIFKRRDVY